MYSENLVTFMVLSAISQNQAPLLKMVRTRFTDPTKGIDLNSDEAPYLLHEYKIVEFRFIVDSSMFAISVLFERFF